jgi:CelD/BcsL family acetyltransferase involved in cellulose biosynthesis
MEWKFAWHYDWPGRSTIELEEAWRIAWESSDASNVFQQPTLSRLWVETVAKPRGEVPVLLTAIDGQRRVYFPLTIRESSWQRGWRRILLPLDELIFEYQDPFVDGPFMSSLEWTDFWLALFRESASQGIHLAHCPHLSCVGTLAENSPERRIKCGLSIVAPFLDLSKFSSFEELFRSLSHNTRRQIIRGIRKIEGRDPNLAILSRNQVSLALEMFENMREVYHIQRGKGGRQHMFLDPLNVSFYRQMIRVGLSAGWIHFSTLNLGDRPISWFIGLEWNRGLYWYKPCYDPEMAALSPGFLHIYYLLIRGFEVGLKTFYFGVNDEPYKYRWTSSATPFYRIVWYPPNLVGNMNFLAHSLVRFWLKERLQ